MHIAKMETNARSEHVSVPVQNVSTQTANRLG